MLTTNSGKIRQIIAVQWVNMFFTLGYVWFGSHPREPPDPKLDSYFRIFHDVVYIPLIEPMVDDLQDFIWRLILSIWRIVK